MLPVFVTAYIFHTTDGYETQTRNFYHASFVPYLIIVLYTMVHALRRGSKAIWFQIAAWTPIIGFSFDRIARGMDLYIGFHELDYAAIAKPNRDPRNSLRRLERKGKSND